MIVEELYDALVEAGASEEKARAASRAIADMKGHFADIRNDMSRVEQKMSEFRSDVDHKISELRSDVDRRISEFRSYVEGMFRLHNWMLGTILAFVVALFFKEFSR